MPETAGTKHVMVRMPPELHAQIEQAAKELDISVAQAVRAGIRRWLRDPSLEEVRPASRRGPCTCHQFTRGIGDTERTLNPSCPQHAETVDA